VVVGFGREPDLHLREEFIRVIEDQTDGGGAEKSVHPLAAVEMAGQAGA
jgi:hypothetical protein